MTALNKQALRSKAQSASAGEWIKESGDGWEAICSADDQANGNFIIGHFEGPDAQANREFVQAANPDTVLALLDELEAAERQSGYLREQRDEWERKAISNFEECAEMSARIEELEAQRTLAFTASNRWADKFRESEKRIAELERANAAQDDHINQQQDRIDTLEKRNSELGKYAGELEARKFKVEMPESFYPDGDTEVPLVLQEHEVIAAIVAAGGTPIAFCRRCKSELDLSHRPDGSHYCHAPDAGIGVKGE